MTALEAYSTHPIPEGLQIHQIRVAMVAYQVLESLSEPHPETKRIISACLLHDMGNLLKFKLDQRPDLLAPEGVSYWREQQDLMRECYGNDEHAATYAIAEALGVSERTLELIHAVGFRNAPRLIHAPLAEKLVCYADQRVSPDGITALQERLEKGVRRYAQRTDPPRVETTHYQECVAALKTIEEDIQQHMNRSLNTITEQPVVESMLRNFPLV